MKKDYLNLNTGIVQIVDNTLIITDNAKKTRIKNDISLLLSFCNCLFMSIYYFAKQENRELLGFLLIVLIDILHIIIITVRFIRKRNYDSTLYLSNIKLITFYNKRFEYYLDGSIVLRDGSIRKIKCSQSNLLNTLLFEELSKHGISTQKLNF